MLFIFVSCISSKESKPGSKSSSNSTTSSLTGVFSSTCAVFATGCLLTTPFCVEIVFGFDATCLATGLTVFAVGATFTGLFLVSTALLTVLTPCTVWFAIVPSGAFVALTTGLCGGAACGSIFSGTAVGAFFTTGLPECFAFLTADGITIGLVIFPACPIFLSLISFFIVPSILVEATPLTLCIPPDTDISCWYLSQFASKTAFTFIGKQLTIIFNCSSVYWIAILLKLSEYLAVFLPSFLKCANMFWISTSLTSFSLSAL